MTALANLAELGLDSWLVCFMLARAVPRPRARLQVALLFGVCDAGASLLAAANTAGLAGALVAAVSLLMLGLFVFGRSRWGLVPVLACLDNLFVAQPASQAALAGALSALFGVLGFVTFELVSARLQQRKLST